MNGYGLTAEIIKAVASLAWPAAAVAVAWLFREKFTELLPRLTLKHKETEVSFRLDQAERDAAQISVEAQSATAPTPEETSRLERVADHSPRAAILEKRAELEQAVRSLAVPYYSGAVRRPEMISLTEAIRLLRKNNILGESESAVLDDLRTIGNRAAHSIDALFTKEDAMRFAKLTDSTINFIRLMS